MSSYWNLGTASDDCVAEGPPLLSQAVVTVLADFTVWVLPLPTLFRARLPIAQRVALIVLFGCGALVVFAACMRTYWIYYVVEETYDVTWEGFYLWIWTALEVHLGVICGCIPCLKVLVRSYQAAGNKGGSKPIFIGGGGEPSAGGLARVPPGSGDEPDRAFGPGEPSGKHARKTTEGDQNLRSHDSDGTMDSMV